MLSATAYRKTWEKWEPIYERHGIIEGQNLIVSVERVMVASIHKKSLQ